MSIENGVHQLGVVTPGNGVVWVQNNLVRDSGGVPVPTGPQTANFVFAGPPSGAAATPTFRPLVAQDINGISGITLPNLNTPILYLGGLTSAFPSLQRVGAEAQFLLADGSNFASVRALNIVAIGDLFGVNGTFTGNVKTGATLEVQNAGSSTNEVLIQHDGANGFIRTQAGALFLGSFGANQMNIGSAAFFPVNAGVYDLGATGSRWATVYGVNGNFTGNVAVTGTVKGSTLAVSTQQKFLATGAGTYNTPAGVRQIKIRMIGGGGSANGCGPAGSDGGVGGNTVFNAVVAAGGDSGKLGGRPGEGGTGGAGAANFRLAGQAGFYPYQLFSGTQYFMTGGNGGGQGATAGGLTTGGGSALANTGGGGQGGTIVGTTAVGSIQNVSYAYGGGQGEYVELTINAPAASYAFSVGAGGIATASSAPGTASGNGGSGYIIVDEYY